MRKLIVLLILVMMMPVAYAAPAGKGVIEAVDLDVHNRTSLQRGARLFHNYCLSCHSAQYMRYSRMANDLGLPRDVVEENLMFTTDSIFDTMVVAMPPEDSEVWYGQAPPDLSLVARARGVNWIYTFMRSFYVDEERPTGMNNRVLSNTSMPHVLADLQGWQKAVYEETGNADGNVEQRFTGYEIVREGSMSPREYDKAVTDLVNYMAYIAEPARLKRERMGFWVILFLAVFTMLAWMLKQEYWKDVH